MTLLGYADALAVETGGIVVLMDEVDGRQSSEVTVGEKEGVR